MLIEEELESIEGVKEAISDYRKEQTKVVFNEEKVSIEVLIEAIKKAGDYEVEVLEMTS